LLYEKGKPTGKVTLTEVSVGAQVGGGSFSEVIFFETQAALNSFKTTKYEMSAAAKATVAASGAAANAKYDQGIAVFTLPKSGAMVAAAIGGQKFKFEPL
jgi:lipid-binding SYLF domain-containing protein